MTRRGDDLARVVHQPQDTPDIGVIRQIDHRPVATRDEHPVTGQDLLIGQLGQTAGVLQSGNRLARASIARRALAWLACHTSSRISRDPLHGQPARHLIVLREHLDEVDVASPGPVRHRFDCLARHRRLHPGIQQGEVDPSDRHQVQLAEMRERHPDAVLVIGEPAQDREHEVLVHLRIVEVRLEAPRVRLRHLPLRGGNHHVDARGVERLVGLLGPLPPGSRSDDRCRPPV